MTTHQSPFGPLHIGVARFSDIDGAERAFADARDWDPAAERVAAMAQALESAAADFEAHSLSPAAEAELRSALLRTPRSA